MKAIVYSLIVFLLSFLNCYQPTGPGIQPNPYAKWAKESEGLFTKNLPKWIPNWKRRSYDLDPLRLKVLTEVNAIDGVEEIPRSSKEKAKFDLLLQRINFPEKIEFILDTSIFGIYFVQGLGVTGLTSFVIDESKNTVGGIVYLDTDLITLPANDWASFKDNTAFHQMPNERLTIQISEENRTEDTLKFIILHELGHIVSVMKNQVPSFQAEFRDFSKFPLFKDVWTTETESLYDQTFFPERSKIKFYSKTPELQIFPEGLSIYRKLKNSAFVSLYAATNGDDSFAEAFAQYVFVVLEKKKYKVQIQRFGKVEFSLENPILLESGRRYREYFESIGLK
ncbi:MAG: hypothetical protein O9301_15225 [Leptospira sp.]|nr:hypothetical protein [Leptospira sp.]